MRELETETIEFTNNYEDLSTSEGFRFRFYCERCDADYVSELQPSAIEADEGFFYVLGELWSEATENGHGVDECELDQEARSALRTAIAEVRENFHECPMCAEWVCDHCWERAMLMCAKCAPCRRTSAVGA